MYKFVLDADGIIKLAKAGMLEKLVESAVCIVPRQVYDEVMKGKGKMHKDALITQSLVAQSKIKIAEHGKTEFAGAGAGESAALAVFRKENADSIISDDLRFLAKLEKEDITFTTPANALVWLAKSSKITKEEALYSLEKLKEFVREEAYERAKNLLGGKENDNRVLPVEDT